MPKSVHKWISLAAWYTLNIVLTLFLLRYTYPVFHNGVVVDYSTMRSLYKLVTGIAQIPSPDSVFLGVVATVGALSAIFWGSATLLSKGADRLNVANIYRATGESFLWLVRQAHNPCIALLIGLPWLGMGLIAADGTNGYAALALVLTSCMLALSLVSNRRVITGERFQGWRCLGWPGWQSLSLFVVATLALDIVDSAVGIADKAFGDLFYPLAWAWDGIYWVGYGVALSALVYRLPWSALGWEIRRRTNLRFLAAWLLLVFRVWVFFLWVIPPIVVIGAAAIFVLPQYQHAAMAAGAALDPLVRVGLSITHVVARNWYLLAAPAVVAFPLVNARFLILYDRLEEKAPSTMENLSYRQLPGPTNP